MQHATMNMTWPRVPPRGGTDGGGIAPVGSDAWLAWQWPEVRLPERPRPVAAQPASRRSAIAAVAVTLGLGLGAFALYQWRRNQQEQIEAPPPALAHPTVSAPVWVPQTLEELEDLRLTARAFVHMTSNLDHQRRLIWAWHWRGTPYPETQQAGDHPTHWHAAEIVRALVDAARSEPPPPTPERAPEMARSIPTTPELTAFTSETPAPGSFYRVRASDELLGEDGIVSRVLYEAAIAVATRKGWPADKAEGRARKVAAKRDAQEAYLELLGQSEWNTGQLEPLWEGTLLWLPPLRRMSLLDRSRSRRICVEPRAWPDGSSKLEPPPRLRELFA